MEVGVIHSRYADTGHWIARCNHETGLIELNRRDFPRLSAIMKDYIWVHEYVHLLYDIHDESECNSLADKIFIARAKTAREKSIREAFVQNSADGDVSGVAITAIIGLVISAASLGIKAYQAYNAARTTVGYYGLNMGDRYLLVKELVNSSFKEAQKNGLVPQDVFWASLSQCVGVGDSYSAWLSQNAFAKSVIAEYEKSYGLKFDEKAKTSLWSINIVKIAVAVLVIAAVVLAGVKIYKMK